MEEDLEGLIQRKIWTVEEQLLPRARDLADKATKLPRKIRKSIPVFPGEWSDNKVKTYLKQLDAAIRNPLRYKNKKILEDSDLSTKGIPDEIFDDTTGIEEIAQLISRIKKEFNQTVVDLSKKMLSEWLKDGIDKAKEKLSEILDKKIALQRISEFEHENLRNELLQKSLKDTVFLASAEDLISKVRFVDKFGVSVKYDGDFNEFESNVNNVHQKLVNLQEQYQISKEEISKVLKDKTVNDADGLLQQKNEEYSERKISLLEEWNMYSIALKSIGQEVIEPPQGIHELEKGVRTLEKKCLESLGEEGLIILKFLRGEENFPDEISKEGIKKALQLLRPLFVRFLRRES